MQQRARGSVVAEVPDRGAVGPWDGWHPGSDFRAFLSAWWHEGDGSNRAGVRHGISGAIPYQGIVRRLV